MKGQSPNPWTAKEFLVDVILDHLKQCLSSFSIVELPFPYCLLWKEVAIHSPDLDSGEYVAPP